MPEAASVVAAEHPEVPVGHYCYTHVEDAAFDAERRAAGRTAFIPGRFISCPHWELRADKPTQQNGFCRLMNSGDWEDEGISLLWDQVKECGINMGEDDVPEGEE